MIKLDAMIDDYLRDESRLADGAADCVYLPENEAEVAEVLRECQAKGTKVTVSGARTGIAGGAVPHGGIVVAAERLAGIEEILRDEASGEWRVRLGPAVSLKTLQTLACTKQAPKGSAPRGIEDFRRDPRRFFFPVDATETTASVGGMAATNASGALSYGYGATRAYVRALRAVLAGGGIVGLRRGECVAKPGETISLHTEDGREIAIPVPTYRTPAIKNTAGLHASSPFDAVDLFIGSEGAFGMITQLELALAEAPALFFGGLAFFAAEAAAVAFVRTVRDGKPAGTGACRPAALEYFDAEALRLADRAENRGQLGLPPLPPAGAAVYFEQGCREDELETLMDAWSTALDLSGGSMEDVWSALEEKERTKLKALRHLVPEEVNRRVESNRRRCPSIHKVGTDLAVPDAGLEEMMRAYRAGLAREGIPAVVFGHIGDNNLHVNMLPEDEALLVKAKALHLEWAALAVRLGGTIAAEHGIGKLKRRLLPVMFSPEALAEMDAVKRALDPAGVLG